MNTNLKASIVQTVYSTVSYVPGVLGLSENSLDNKNKLKISKTFDPNQYFFSEKDIYIEGTDEEFVIDLHVCTLDSIIIADLCNEIKKHIEYALNSNSLFSNKKYFIKITVNKIISHFH